ncbi:MAG: 50S ribosome-binding GTPase [Planctomycetaceae bacterium]|nr:50S ribosome-binding GTPase [Planctomycetaceae bacterium]
MWNPFRSWSWADSVSEIDAQRALLLKQAPIPCLWLFGKTGSGKTSIIHHLTGAADAEIGSGFRPQTRQSRMYDFPEDELPLVKFLDTRGLGEAAYDPAEDIARFDSTAHLLIVTVRATDQAAAAVIEPLRAIRKQNPSRPVLLVITCLHDAYPGQQHPRPDPFSEEPRPRPVALPETLSRCLDAHYERFDGLFDRAVPIDLTKPTDGFEEAEFGGERLKRAILDQLPAAYRQTLLQMDHVRGELRDRHGRRSSRIILAHSVIAASAAAVPIPWVDIPVVMATQSHLLHRLAVHHHQTLDSKTLLKMSGVLGGRIALRMGVRELLKFIPWVGMAANAAAAFAFTYGSGEAASWYFREAKAGHVPTAEQLRTVFQEQLQVGARLWRTSQETTDL